MSVMAKEQEFELHPLFIDYGQLAAKREWEACLYNHSKHSLPVPKKIVLKGFGRLIHSGITDVKMRLKEDAFLPGRNSLFLIVAGSYAYQIHCKNVAIGLLNDEFALFPDQKRDFISLAEKFISNELAYDLTIVTPLIEFNKAEVLKLAKSSKITKTYSCHLGTAKPCGKCISCLERKDALKVLGGK